MAYDQYNPDSPVYGIDLMRDYKNEQLAKRAEDDDVEFIEFEEFIPPTSVLAIADM